MNKAELQRDQLNEVKKQIVRIIFKLDRVLNDFEVEGSLRGKTREIRELLVKPYSLAVDLSQELADIALIFSIEDEVAK